MYISRWGYFLLQEQGRRRRIYQHLPNLAFKVPGYGLNLETREKNPWIPFTDEDKEVEWMHHHTGAAILYAD